MQHAKANPKEEDAQEGLSDEGIQQAMDTGRILKKLGAYPDCVIVSPKKRSKQTAEIIAEQIGISTKIFKETEAIKAKAGIDVCIKYLSSLKFFGNLLIIGHLPLLQELVKKWTGATVVFRNAGCLLLELEEFDTKNASIIWHLP